MQFYMLLISFFLTNAICAVEGIPFSSPIRSGDFTIIHNSQAMHIHGFKKNIAMLVALQDAEGKSFVALNNEVSVDSIKKFLGALNCYLDASQWKALKYAIVAPGNMKKRNRSGKWMHTFDDSVSKDIRSLRSAITRGIPKSLTSHCELYTYIPSLKVPVLHNGGRFGRYTMPDLKVLRTKEGSIEWSYRGDGYQKHTLLGQ